VVRFQKSLLRSLVSSSGSGCAAPSRSELEVPKVYLWSILNSKEE
jgi:hypothetical protein